MTKVLIYSLLIFTFYSCSKNTPVINDIKIVIDDQTINGSEFHLDYTDAIDSGFVFPSKQQSKNGYFTVRFNVTNLDKDKKYYYKIYYQNESYKFDELRDSALLVHENFYGSWNNSTGFKEIPQNIAKDGKGLITAELRIQGNPRDEYRYFDHPQLVISEESIQSKIKEIQNTPDWLNAVKEKASANQTTLEKQLRDDATFVLSEDAKKSPVAKINYRNRRNLRTGEYSVLVVVVDEEELKSIPNHIVKINTTSPKGIYENPYRYFLSQQKNQEDGITFSLVKNAFKLKANPDLGKGIYFNKKTYPGKFFMDNFTASCNSSDRNYKESVLEQFIHSIDSNALLNNVPLVADVVGDNYPKHEFVTNMKKYSDEQRVKLPMFITDCPCKTVTLDTTNNSIVIKNPGNTKGKFKKENVGVNTRHPFTYGKYTVKIKMAEQMNKENVWNGLTNAIWLITASNQPYNNRRTSSGNGYIPKPNDNTEHPPRYKRQSYSEIDFEIVKCAHYWPKTSYNHDPKQYKKDLPEDDNKVMVTCTNWDLACDDVKDFINGARNRKVGNKEYELHRWDTWYKALTIKTPAVEDELFASAYYYFQIEWTPKEIIWRIGPEKNKLKEVGRMNDKITQIPNNQMVLAITQEFHLADWWPEAPFSQDDVPFPSKDLTGRIFSIEIE